MNSIYKTIVRTLFLAFLLVGLTACEEQKARRLSVFGNHETSSSFDLDAIQMNGELIVLTLYGPQSYFEFYGEGFGTQFRIIEQYARSIGCTTRVEVLRNEADLIQRLKDGEGDVVACGIPVTDSLEQEFYMCGQQPLTHFIDSLHPVTWLVRFDAPRLAQSLDSWMTDNQDRFTAMTTIKVTDDKGRVYTPRRHVYSPVLNLAKGQISQYDHLFRKYASHCSFDWKLLAAQAYQESAFDCNAVSYMGALGLMQLMPRTAQSMGVSISQAFDPESNLRGASKYIVTLQQHYSSISDPSERTKFVLAAYNGGMGHIDDARALAKKYNRNPDVWSGNVDQFVLHLSESRYYNDPVVKCGYMRGSETYGYVSSIMDRWATYRRI